MNMQAKTPTMVTVAKAAELLSAAGDKIDASNVSRYLARHGEIPSERKGRARMVDIVALAAHRQTNVFVADKQADRGIGPDQLQLGGTAKVAPSPAGLAPTDPDAGTMSEVNLALRQLELKKRTREEDQAAGRLVPDKDVLELISTVMRTVNASLERQEAGMAQQFGREVATFARRSRKAAFADAAGRLAELAQRHLPPGLASQAAETNVSDADGGAQD